MRKIALFREKTHKKKKALAFLFKNQKMLKRTNYKYFIAFFACSFPSLCGNKYRLPSFIKLLPVS